MIGLSIYVDVGGEAQGPFSSTELSRLWQAGELDASARYWHRGRPGWSPVSSFAVPRQIEISPSDILLTTTGSFVNRSIERELEIVSGEFAFAQNVFADIAAALIDITGGRNSGLQNAMRDGKRACLDRLRADAVRCGGDAVIGVNLSYATLGVGYILLAAHGTAVLLGPPPVE